MIPPFFGKIDECPYDVIFPPRGPKDIFSGPSINFGLFLRRFLGFDAAADQSVLLTKQFFADNFTCVHRS